MNCGLDFWNAVYYENLALDRLGLAFTEGFVLGSFGFGAGRLIQAAGLTGLKAFGVGAFANVASGAIWDVAVRGYTPSDAFVRNAVSFGIGEVVGYGARQAVSAVRRGGIRFIASNGTEITGYSHHGINRAIGDGAKRAGTAPQAILDALYSPRRIIEGIDEFGRPFEAFYGANARVIVNPQTGRIASVNPLSGAGVRGLR